MADIFVSYAREEAARAEEVRRALEALGLTVFFDVERLDAGDVWSDVIDRELKSAGAVVALWSPHALSRPWVRKECALAQGRGVLVPALLEPVNDLTMPVQFSDLQRLDLSDFHGQPDHPGWRKLVRALAKTLKRNDLLAAQIVALKEEKQTAKVKAELEATQKQLAALKKSKGALKPAILAAGAAAIIALGAGGAWWGWRQSTLTAEQVRSGLVSSDARKALALIADGEMANGDSRRLLESVLRQVSLSRLIEASTVDADAALLAGWAFRDGTGGVPKDEVEALRLFSLSCDLKSPRGCNNVGRAYANGAGVTKDVAKAASLYAMACELGSAAACANLGYMHENGVGVLQSTANAQAFYRKACDLGLKDTCERTK